MMLQTAHSEIHDVDILFCDPHLLPFRASDSKSEQHFRSLARRRVRSLRWPSAFGDSGAFEVSCEASAPTKPSEGALDNSASGI
ncbi:hypothetical protein FBZ93_116183 [Bradyrhizobium macuxiense]|uniref:Uncharacterized protein n=1 Tax=Bradyrhizobium macuxiense TaxID=1755647 RepID=A0A560L4U8_9BRAD|nr:hypothetical protein FBZ93_116183 [Bradyrhizobium macuxiense]